MVEISMRGLIIGKDKADRSCRAQGMGVEDTEEEAGQTSRGNGTRKRRKEGGSGTHRRWDKENERTEGMKPIPSSRSWSRRRDRKEEVGSGGR
jgi:hypothetical protein